VVLHLEEEQYKALIKKKGKTNWVDFIMQLAEE